MMGYRLGVSVLVLGLACGFAGDAWGAKQKPKPNNNNKNNNNVKNEQVGVAKARDALVSEQKQVAQARTDLANAETHLKQVTVDVKKVRDKVEDKYEATSGISKLLSEQMEAQEAYDARKKPLLDGLKSSGEYAAAVKQAETASALLKTLGAEPGVVSSKREAAAKDALAVSALEKKTLDADSKLVALREKLTAINTKVAAARDGIRERAEKDPELKSALSKLDGAKKDVTKAKETLAKEMREVQVDAAKLATQQQQLNAAQAKAKTNNNPKKPNNKNGKR